MSNQERLGQGLSALLGSAATKTTPTPIDSVRMIAIEKLQSGANQPRNDRLNNSVCLDGIRQWCWI